MESDSALVAQVLRGIVPPALVAAVVLSLAWRPWRKERRELSAGSGWGAPLALGLGFAAAHVALHGWPPWRLQPDVKHRLFWVALLLALVLAARAGRPRSGWSTWLARSAAFLAAAGYLLWFRVAHGTWSLAQGAAWVAAFALVGAVVAGTQERVARRRPGPDVALAWIVIGTLASFALFLGKSATLAQMAGGLVTVLGASAVLGFRQPGFSLAGGGATCAVGLHGGLLLAGHYTAYLPASSALLLAAAPLVLLVSEVPLFGRLGAWKRRVALVLAVGVPCGAAVWLARDALPSNPYY